MFYIYKNKQLEFVLFQNFQSSSKIDPLNVNLIAKFQYLLNSILYFFCGNRTDWATGNVHV